MRWRAGAHQAVWSAGAKRAEFPGAGRACAASDLGGHGRWPGPPGFLATGIADRAADGGSARDLLDAPTVVVGHSMGALPALLAASQRTVAGVVLMAPSPPANLPGALGLPPVPADAARAAPAASEIRARFLATSPTRDVSAVTQRLNPESPRVLNDRYLLRVPVDPAAITAPGLCLEAGLDTHDRHPPGQDRAIARLFGFSHAVLAGQPHCMMYGDAWQASADTILGWYRQQFG
ncbi:alpha/beta hydrolase [Achromobacter ruhlandii]|uniref:Alpha/beta hydrolase n=1 Tax=Achromobacter ruhlandii TaxID=72557 RepID=A0A848NRW9_9BURK|nr:alpha/beta hydrolase [Achromobacter ruhlandii]NMU93794.1 alpha/beta hydrolase [Achromobacter ruhlandii]